MEYGTTTRQATEASDSSALDVAPAAPSAGSRPERWVLARHVPRWWPLLAVLAVQAVLSVRLVRADTAFEDEATYLWAGHLEWAHWLHGTPIPHFPAYFSGAPVIYPPIGALADSIGGLTAARILSLIFMLGATTLLWGAASRLYGRRAAFFAAALFAVLGPALHLGAFATYDAMSLFLVALASWLAISAGDRGDATGRMVIAGLVLALANAAAYSSALFDPVVVLIVLLTALPNPGGRIAFRRVWIFVVVLVTPLLLGLLIGGSSYFGGIERTTLARVPGAASPLTVLADSWSWAGLVVVLAACGSRHQRGEPSRPYADVAAGGSDLGGDPGATGPSALGHRGVAEQARWPRSLVRGYRCRLRRGLVCRCRTRWEESGSHLRCLCGGLGLPDIAGGQSVVGVLH